MSLTISLRRTTTAGISSTTTTSTLLLSSRTIPSTTNINLGSPATTTGTTGKTTFICSQCRHATLLRRPKRPYTFTQLVTLSDGSTYTHRTSSPVPIYRSTRDTRNSLLWNPSSSKLMNVEEDEAGRLAAFRARFGRGFDAATAAASTTANVDAAGAGGGAGEVKQGEEENNKAKAQANAQAQAQAQAEMEEAEDDAYDDNLLDLISSFGQEDESQGQQGSAAKKKK